MSPSHACDPGTGPAPPACPHSFKDCIPRSFRQQIQQHNAFTQLRLWIIFHKFLWAFQPGHLSQQVIMVKYLATLERLAPRFGSERVPVCHLELLAQAKGKPCYVEDSSQAPPDPGPESAPGPPTHEVLVTGTGGIRWRPAQAEVSTARLRGVQVGLGRGSCSVLASVSEGSSGKPFLDMALGCVSFCPLGSVSWGVSCLPALWGPDFWGLHLWEPLWYLGVRGLGFSSLPSLRFWLLACVCLGGMFPVPPVTPGLEGMCLRRLPGPSSSSLSSEGMCRD